MSFRDVGKSSVTPKVSLPPQRNRQRDPPPQAEVDPKAAVDQISEALKLHERDRHVLKEKGLIAHSTTVPRYDSPTSLSAFSRLNDEIVQFQKMVNELHLMVDSDVMTPGDQWRTRILLQSAENAATDLDSAIKQSPWNQKDLAVKASFSKLKRDFERAHKMYSSAVTNYHRKQNAEAALLFSRKEERPSRERIQDQEKQRTLADEEKEDFFERAMREREEETLKINTKIHVVNNIYRELGRLVSDQQEKVDLVEDQIRYARANTEVGLENLEQANVGMCGLAYQLERPLPRREQPPELVTMEELNWKLPFQTFPQDIFEVRNDLVDLVHVSASKIQKLRRRELFTCGSSTVFDDDTGSVNTEVYVENKRRSRLV